MLEGASESSRKQRKSRPKARTGCITCKKRRVKCDETKPSCQRCVKFGFKCDGYAADIKAEPLSTALIVAKPLLPKPSALRYSPINAIRRPHLLNEQEYRYFRVFCDQTVSSLSGFFDEPLWGRLVLQACAVDPTICHAVVAIGALDKTLDTTSQARYGMGSVQQRAEALDGEAHYKFAVQQYAKAIKGMRDSVAKGRQDLSSTLIACLLAVCFELFHGNMQSALAQAQSGLKLINQFLENSKVPVKRVTGIESPIPNVIDEELIQVFARLDIHAISFKSTEGVEINTLVKKDIKELCVGMPTVFSTLREARVYWEILLRQALHWTVCTYFWGSDARDNPNSLTGVTGSSSDKGKTWFSTSSLEERKDVLEQQDRYLDSLICWAKAFDPLLKKARASCIRNNVVGATALYLRFVASHLALAGSIFKEEVQFDKQEKVFLEIISLAQFLIDDLASREAHRKVNFMFDSGIIGPLYVVAVLCRNPKIRRKALCLLEANPRREGVWDSVLAAKAATVIMNIEEKGIEGDYIPEHSRLRGIKLTSDLQQRTGGLQYFIPKRGEAGAFLVRQVNFSW